MPGLGGPFATPSLVVPTPVNEERSPRYLVAMEKVRRSPKIPRECVSMPIQSFDMEAINLVGENVASENLRLPQVSERYR